jgi:hypothetical protein
MNLNTDVSDVRYEIVPYELDRHESPKLGSEESESLGCGTATDTEALPDYNEILVSQIIIEESVDLQLIIGSERFRSLVKSIDEAGFVMNPVHVRSGEQGVYHLITGRQRYLAAKLLGYERIRALVTDENPAMVIFKDNVLRGSVTVIEEAEIYDELRRSKVPDGYSTPIIHQHTITVRLKFFGQLGPSLRTLQKMIRNEPTNSLHYANKCGTYSGTAKCLSLSLQ